MLFAASVPLNAEPILPGAQAPYLQWLTNSILVSAIVIVVITVFARSACARMKLVPDGSQNLFEALVEGLYSLLEGIVGRHMIAKTFGFLASLFIFILVSNWFGLLPGVGSIGWKTHEGLEPLLRPATADLNMTLGLAILAMVLWLVWSLREVGVGGMLHHIFGPKGGMTGIMGKVLVPVFFVIGILEVISIATRPVSLSLRLFGNIYAGENILSLMIGIGHEFHLPEWATAILGVIVPIPFYFLEVMVGLLQAFVFMLLCAVYIQLSTSHDEDAH
jgi:F-type H+-transporting ATPase subunit a